MGLSKLSLLAAFGGLLSVATADITAELTYFQFQNCTSAPYYATLPLDECYNLDSPVESINVDMDQGYYVYGYDNELCQGSPIIVAYNPADAAECFNTGVDMGTPAEAYSFKFQQIPPP